ncbi:MAG: Ig-like domain-containing protein [Gillisia sp.]
MNKKLLLSLLFTFLFTSFFAPIAFAQISVIDFEDPPEIGAIKSISVEGFTFSSNLTNQYNIGFGQKGVGGSYALVDGNLIPGGLTRWTITRDGGSEFQFREVWIFNRDPFASGSGTIRGYKNSTPTGSAKPINFSGVQSFASDPDFYDVDEIRIEASDIYVAIDNFTYGSVFTEHVNSAPTAITLSSTSINENIAANSTVGSLTTTDPDAANTFTYTLVNGTGDTDNSSFTISGANLRITNSPNFEVKNSYSVRIRTTDQGGLIYEEAFTITINNVNESPTDISLSSTSINDGAAANSTVGTLTTTDPDASNTFTYTLVAGTGDSDNASFNISGANLRITNSPNFAVKNSYTVRIRTTDQGGLFYDEAFTITINEINEDPTDLSINSNTVAENSAIGTAVGTFSGVDLNTGDTFTYSFAPGVGDLDNGAFSISGDELQTAAVFDFETKNSYSIRIRVTDSGDLFFERQFTINVINVNEAPTVTAPLTIQVFEDEPQALTAISFSDLDAGSNAVTATFSVASGTLSATSGGGVTVGSTSTDRTLSGAINDINTFISAGNLKFTTALNATANVTLSITINDNGNTGSGGDLTDQVNVTLNVTAVNDPPVNIIPGSQQTDQNVAVVFSSGNGNPISVSDVDAGGGTLRVTLTAGNGSITLSDITGLSFIVGTGSNDSSMTFEGSIVEINAALSGLIFSPTEGYNGPANLIVITSDLGLSGSGGTQTDSDEISITVNSINPVITGVSSDDTNGVYQIGDQLTLTVNFSEAVFLSTGTIQLNLETGLVDRVATYLSGSGSSTIYFSYIVQEGDFSYDLDYISSSALDANGDSVQSATFLDAVLTLASPGAAGSLSANKNLIIDGIIPSVASVSVPADGTYVAGQNLNFTVNFSEVILVTGTPQIGLTIGSESRQASYVSGSGSSALVFSYTVQSGDLDLNGISMGSSISLNGGTVRDAAGNNVNLTLNSVGSTSGVLVDGVIPSVISFVVDNTDMAVGEMATVTITFSEAITGLTSADFTIANGILSGLTTPDGGLTWTATLTPTNGIEDATNVITLDNLGYTDLAGNPGTGTTTSNNYSVDTVKPAGYSVEIDQSRINGENQNAVSFTFTNAEVGTTYAYSFSSNNGGTNVTGSGTVSTAIDQITGIDLSGLEDGIITLAVTLTDASLNEGMLATDTTIKDTNEAPLAVCKDFTATLDVSGNVTISNSDVDGGSDDDKAGFTLSLNKYSFDCSNVGINEVELTITDSDGLTATCLATVTIVDNIAPTITCSGDIVVNTDLGSCEAMVTIPVPLLSDNCIISISGSGTESDPFTTLEQSNSVPDGTHFFDVNGNKFSTVIEDGWILIASSSKTTSIPELPTTSALSLQSNKILAPAVYADGSISSIRINATGVSTTGVSPILDISTGDAEVLANLRANRTLTTGVMGGINEWSGADQGRADGSCASSTGALAKNIFHACGNFNGIHWIPEGNLYADTYQTYKNDLNLWVKAKPSVSDPGSSLVNDFNGTSDASGVYPVGTTTVNWTVTDASGNSAICTQTVTVSDNENPTSIARDITVELDETGYVSITAADIDNGSNDACGIASMSVTPDTFTCAEVGANTVTLTVVDNSGNESTATSTVTIEDNIPAIVIAKDITVELDENGLASITPDQLNNGSTDNCEISSISIEGETTAFAEVVENQNLTITLPAGKVVSSVEFASYGTPTGSNGNYTLGSCHAANSQSIVEGYAIGKNSFTIPATNGVFGDPCGGTFKRLYVVVNYSAEALDLDFTCNDIGDHTVTLIVTDINGNKAEATATVTVEDNISPVVNTVGELTVQLNENGQATITVDDIDNGSTDNCAVATRELDITGFDCSNVGTPVEVTLTVTDVNGNSETGTAMVTVEDNISPVVTTVGTLTVQLDENGQATIDVDDIDNGSTDNCAIATRELDITGFDCSNVGTPVEVTLTVTDVSGISETGTAKVTVEDNVSPVAIAKDITVQLDVNGTATITAADIDNGSNDACGVANLTLDITEFGCAEVGSNTVTLTVTDNNGNESTTIATVTVEDNVSPVLSAEADQDVALDTSCSITVPNLVDGSTVTDNCNFVITQLPIAGTVISSEHNATIEVVVTATDAAGNTDETTVVLTVKDLTVPVLTAEADQNVNLDSSCSITVPNVIGTATDNCTVEITQLPLAGTVISSEHNATIEVVVTATDAAGNTDETTVVLTAKDVTAPVLSAGADQDVNLDPSCSITVPNVIGTATDNCAVEITQLPLTGTVISSEDNTTIEVVVTATDAAGNTDETTVVLTAKDVTDPELTAEADQDVNLDDSCSITVPNLVDGSTATDNCTFEITQLPLAGTVISSEHNATIEVVVTATDAAGNTEETTVILTAKDVTVPVLTPVEDKIENLTAACEFEIPDYSSETRVTDNCGVSTISQTPVAGTILNGHGTTQTITLTASDGNGNSAITEFSISLVDKITPMPSEISLEDITAACEIAEADVTIPTATDNCGGIVSVSHNTSFPITQQGLTVITWSFEDVNGNISKQIQNVIIENVTAPVPDVPVLEEIVVECGISDFSAPTATDSCGETIIATSEDPLSYNDPGEYMILWEFSDGSGNVSTQEQWVTVMDVTAPSVVIRDITVYVALDEPAFITPEDIDGGTTDNCSEITLSIDRDTFDQPGTYQVILTATDGSGNTSQDQATVEVKREGPDPSGVHVVPTILSGSTISKVIMPFNHRIVEVQVLEVESKKYKMFPGNKSNSLEINVAPLRGTLLVRIVDQTGKVHLKKLIVL